MSDVVEDEKFVEIIYKVMDEKSGQILTSIEFPLGYVHGQNDVLASYVLKQLEGKKEGDTIEVKIDGNQLFGPRDENLVFTDHIENVPEEYREVGTKITMENDKGETKNFIVTRIDDQTLTVDGNNPLCGRNVVFQLEVLKVREATEREIEAGGAVLEEVDVDGASKVPL
ncbi:MAG: FKBP-type peptidyl-prolyl cis-trans isomerase [Hyphomicrobiales bacterium]